MKEIRCNKCKKIISEIDLEKETRIVYCDDCELYFINGSKNLRKEIEIPNGSSSVRLKYDKNSVIVKIRWFGNYSFKLVMLEFLGITEGILSVLSSTFAYLVNNTIIEVNKEYLKIEHKPIDTQGMTFYKSSLIEQLYVKKIGSFPEVYGLFCKLKIGEETMLIKNLDKRAMLFIIQEIGKVISLKNVDARYK